ncbi:MULTISPECIES: MFS transporter [unclassified Rhodococcus (in: high G+C Gram-positive bacteria)]|uniref:MFS transporter n=1 Tax=unclassified Rhodococcus (in: high G+C Gram-positive bacteria) TaxID=192944 RepID=UPI00163A484B|nr:MULTISPECIES: MFS transporter [unclassified Rhodococcus (in: high G+C Gram-positive bacteria)]MBC2638797.1 MFS transporter [Rhodococcus sp. 3A]MBC2896462.1 MFS transporter [Rhodococcus sp. 4CII]
MALLVAGALFMEILDATIITPAVPLIAESFGVDAVDVNVAISAYLVTVAVLIPASGWMAERFGTRRVFVTAIAVFTLASIGCAASASLPMLVAMRVLQGVGGAMMVPVGRLAVLRSSTKGDLVRAIALLTWPALAAPVIAPLLGGAIATVGSWRWIFVINIPIGLLGILLSLKLVHGSRAPSTSRLDWRGLLGVGTGIAAALIALESIRVTGTDWRRVVVGGVVAVVLLTASAVHLLRARNPLVDFRVLRVRTLRTTVTGGSLYRLTVTAVPFLLPLQFQLGFGWTPFLAGLLVAALFAGNIAVKPCTTPLMRRFGIRPILLVNALLSVGCFGLLAALSASTPVPVIAAVLFVSGALRSVGFTAYNSLAFSDVDRADLTHANTLNAAVQELAAGLGIAVAALALTVFTPVASASDQGFGSEYSWAFVVLGVLMFCTVVDTLRLPRDAGASVTR